HVAENGGLVEEAAQIVTGASAAQQGGTALDRGADLIGYPVAQVAARHWADVGVGRFGVTDGQSDGVLDDQARELLGDRGFDDEALGGDATLTGVEEPASDGQIGDPGQ